MRFVLVAIYPIILISMILNAKNVPIQNTMILSKKYVPNVQLRNRFLTAKTVKHAPITSTIIEQHTFANSVQEVETLTQKTDNVNAQKHNFGMIKTA